MSKFGFYDINKLDTAVLKKFYKDAVMLSYNIYIDKLDIDISYRRMSAEDKTIGEMIEGANSKYHNVCIDRSIQYDKTLYGEIGYVTNDTVSYYLFIHVSLDNLKKLTTEYNLIMK